MNDNFYFRQRTKEIGLDKDVIEYPLNIEVLGLDELKIGKYTPFPIVDTLYYYLRDNTEYDGILAEEFSEQSNYFKKWGKKG